MYLNSGVWRNSSSKTWWLSTQSYIRSKQTGCGDIDSRYFDYVRFFTYLLLNLSSKEAPTNQIRRKVRPSVSLVFCLAEDRCLFKWGQDWYFRDALSRLCLSFWVGKWWLVSRAWLPECSHRWVWGQGCSDWDDTALLQLRKFHHTAWGTRPKKLQKLSQPSRATDSYTLSCERLRPRCLLSEGETWGSHPLLLYTCCRGCHVLKMAPATALQEPFINPSLSTHDQFCEGRVLHCPSICTWLNHIHRLNEHFWFIYLSFQKVVHRVSALRG